MQRPSLVFVVALLVFLFSCAGEVLAARPRCNATAGYLWCENEHKCIRWQEENFQSWTQFVQHCDPLGNERGVFS